RGDLPRALAHRHPAPVGLPARLLSLLVPHVVPLRASVLPGILLGILLGVLVAGRLAGAGRHRLPGILERPITVTLRVRRVSPRSRRPGLLDNLGDRIRDHLVGYRIDVGIPDRAWW